MTGERPITERTANVAAQLAERWATAINAQARRIQHPTRTAERVPDALVQVSLLHQLLRAAQMAEKATEAPAAKRRIRDGIQAFADAIVVQTTLKDKAEALALARNVLEHFDEYWKGTGDAQQPGTRRHTRAPRERLAQDYRWELDGPADGALRMRIGPRPGEPIVMIDLVERAPKAARQLATTLGHGDGAWAPL
jgi:hypothetical protein